ncbi:trigger factor [soil metagenome]
MSELAETKKNQGGDGSTLAAVLEKKSERIPYEVVEEEKMAGSRVRFKLKISEEAMAGRLTETLKEFNKQVRVSGFRPGKAPPQLVRARFEAPAREETIKRMVDRLAELYAEDRKYEPVSPPFLLDHSSTKGQGATVELALEIHPEVNVTDETLADLKTEIHRIKLDDDFVAKSLEGLRAQNATYEPSEEGYEPKDGLLFNCAVTDTTGRKIADRSVQAYYSTKIEDEMPKPVAEALVGKKKGEKLSLDVTEDAEGAEPGTLESVHYEVEVLEVKKRNLPNLDDEFAQDVNEAYQNLGDLRKGVQDKAGKDEEARQREEALNGVYSVLRDRLEFDLPRALVDNNVRQSINEMEQRLNQYGISLNNMDQEIVKSYAITMQDQARVNVKNYLILRALGKKLNVTPSQEHIDSSLAEIAKSSGRKPLAIRANLEAKKQWPQFIEDLTLKLTNDELLKRASLSHKEVSVDEYEAHRQKLQADQAAKLQGTA